MKRNRRALLILGLLCFAAAFGLTGYNLSENSRAKADAETAILQLQQSPTPEQLAHTLTVVRRCMQAGGQWIVAVEPVPGGGQV